MPDQEMTARAFAALAAEQLQAALGALGLDPAAPVSPELVDGALVVRVGDLDPGAAMWLALALEQVREPGTLGPGLQCAPSPR